ATGKGATLVRVTSRALVEEANAALEAGPDALLALGARDPLVVLAAALDREGTLDAAARAGIVSDVRARIDAAVLAAERAAPPARQTLFDDVYAKVPPHLAAQQAAAQKEQAP
ncbi:MAG: Branched-chain alpha-keto acid dehydrogenase, component, alpha subunit, partial [Labilithrix sp.]|nr:Branched-chain alpha-keto acid dehydrogenase, component, alpha subunit [Labilithrix sp.]